MKYLFSPPNQLTFLRILLTPLFLYLLFSNDSLFLQISLLVFIIMMLTDWYDGWVARKWGYVTRWGTFFDPLADKIVTSATLIGFIILNLVPSWPIWIIVIRDVIITGLRTFAELKGKSVKTSRLAKTKTLLQFIVIYYILILFVVQKTEYFSSRFSSTIETLLNYQFIYTLTVITAAITLWTGILYLWESRSTIKELYFQLNKKKSEISPSHQSAEVNQVPNFVIRLFASFFLTGYSPIASGTVSSGAALLIFFIPFFNIDINLFIISIIVFSIGVPLASAMEKYYGKDPSQVTIDEAVGMWISLLWLPKTPIVFLSAFFLFRFFDIIKIFPATYFDRKRGGFAIMMDDVVAAVYANVVAQSLCWFNVIG